MKSIIFYTIFLLLRRISGQELFPTKISFDESTRMFFGDNNDGTVAAFADYNGDGSPDVFTITNDGHGVDIYSKSEATRRWEVTTGGPAVNRPNDSIVSVTPADFTGDKIMDLLVLAVADENPGPGVSAYLYVGQKDLLFRDVVPVAENLVNQPLVADYDHNMVADVFGAKDGKLQFWVYDSAKQPGFTEKQIADADPQQTYNFAFVSLDKSDLVAGLFVESMTDTTASYRYYRVKKSPDGGDPEWSLDESKSHDLTSSGPIGLSSFVDIDADGSIDQVVPLCDTPDCSQGSRVKYYSFKDSDSQWSDILAPEQFGDWHFAPPDDNPAPGNKPVGFKLREGDVNLDSFPDFVCTMRKGSNQTNEVMLLINQKGASLRLDTSVPTGQGGTAFVASFVDISSTAILDVIVNTEHEDGTNKFHLMTSPFSPDANFVKVEVVTRTCGSSKCIEQSHVANQPGPVTEYATTTPSGEKQHLIAVLLSQSAYLSLQLPYVIMGLGQNPNFVDNVTVGIPNVCCGLGVRRTKSWLSLIPNSQLIVYPAELDDPARWESNLIIHPSQSVLLTGVVLIGTCAFIALIAGVLHLLERREDDKQKRQEAHKFHFDAM